MTRPVVEAASPIPAMKAVKNEAEQNGFRLAMQRDGAALVKFLKWMEEQTIDGTMTELTVSDRLEQLRSEQPLYRGLSFDTISAYGPHGAIVHYEPTQETDVPLQRKSLLLIDSGAQYQNGTTDITRTLALGELTEEERKVYTLVLKGHIQLQMLIFPKGASGTQLDAVARRDLWQHGYNFLHGTGHGVGSFLNVHEGPHQIRMEYVAQPLCEGMTVTDEPGIYFIPALIDNWKASGHCKEFLNFDKLETYKDFGGIRIEDDVLITADGCRFIGDERIPYHAKDVEAFMANN